MKLIDKNNKAYFDYLIEETFEAGIVLEGNEVKSIKEGNVNLKDSFCHMENGELWLKNCHVAPYNKGSFFNAEPMRNRKLLLHKSELRKIAMRVKTKNLTLVPTKIYLQKNLVKLEVALAKGKKSYDKRESLKEKDIKRDLERQISKN